MESPDVALVALFLMTAGYAAATGLVVGLRQRHRSPALVAGTVFAGVSASLFGVLLLANIAAWVGAAVALVLVGVACFAVVRNDRPRHQAVALAVGVTLLVAGAGLFVSYLALISFIITASTYLVARLWWEPRRTLVVMGAALGGMLSLSAVAFGIALSQM